MTAEPVLFEPTPQKDIADCGIACLRMLTGLSYAQVSAAFSSRARIAKLGATARQIRRAARMLGFPLRYVKATTPGFDAAEWVGMVDLQRPVDAAVPVGEWEGHFVMGVYGVVYNPADGMVWTDVESFCRTRRWDVVGVYVRTDGGSR